MNLLAAATETKINLKENLGDFQDLGGLEVPSLISGLIRGSMIIAAVIFFFMLVIGGIKWIMSGGDKASTEGARNQITAALVGLVIVFSAWAIAALINTFFGIDIFSLKVTSII